MRSLDRIFRVKAIAAAARKVFTPASLFKAGEQGAWYDPSDINLTWRRNLLTYTEQFDNAAWVTKTLASVTANQEYAPDGTFTAEQISAQDPANNTFYQVRQNYTAVAGTYTLSYFFKNSSLSTLSTVNLSISDITNSALLVAEINPVTLTRSGATVTGSTLSEVSTFTTPELGGWTRLCLVFTLSLNATISVGLATTKKTATTLGSMFAWGAQLEVGSTATPYQRITDGVQDYLQYQAQPVLYQDAAGTVPVTAVGQPVGLMLDKSKGLVLGPELVTNGDFSNGATRWAVGAGWSVSGGAANASASSAALSQNSVFTSGKWYKLTFQQTFQTGSLQLRIAGAQSIGYFNNSGVITTYVYATVSGALEFNGTSLTTVIDNISVRELPGNHAFQTTSANRPVLSARVNLATETEFKNGLSDAPARGGSITATTLSGYQGALAFGSGVDTYAYKTGIAQNGINQTFTCVVKMDDGGAPMFSDPGNNTGVNNDFVIVIGGNVAPIESYTFTALGGGFYRVTAPIVSPTVVVNNTGVLKYSSNSNRTFKVTAYDLRVTNTGVNLPPYQRVNTSTDYDTVGFPLYLKANGTNTAMQTNSVDFTGTDKMTVVAGVGKLSDVAFGSILELSTSADANVGSFNIGSGTTVGDASRRTWGAVCNGSTNNLGGAAVYASPDSRVQTVQFDIAQSTAAQEMVMRLNGTQQTLTFSAANSGTGTYGNYPLYLFARAGTSLFFNGNFYGAIIRGAQSTAAQISSAEQWMNQKTKAYA